MADGQKDGQSHPVTHPVTFASLDYWQMEFEHTRDPCTLWMVIEGLARIDPPQAFPKWVLCELDALAGRFFKMADQYADGEIRNLGAAAAEVLNLKLAGQGKRLSALDYNDLRHRDLVLWLAVMVKLRYSDPAVNELQAIAEVAEDSGNSEDIVRAAWQREEQFRSARTSGK